MYNKILVPLDGSQMSECSLEQAREIAVGCHVREVILLAVIEPSEQRIPFLWGGAGTASRADAAEIKKDRAQLATLDKTSTTSAAEYLKRTAERLSKEGMTVRTEVIEGKAADAILDYAAKNGIDLVIMSSHGRGGKGRWDMGKVTDRIIRMSMTPVIVASPPGCRV